MNEFSLIENPNEYIEIPKEHALTHKKLYMHMMNKYALANGVITQDMFNKAEELIEKIHKA